ncbi:hypothetical protein M0805_002499 [Coniferiporia weirii]|nr:hypothetical protein M0805_002499 [Coniferiporia weirii]
MLSLKLFPFDLRSLRKASAFWQGMSPVGVSRSQTERAIAAYYFYEELSLLDIKRMHKVYGRMGRAHKRIGYELGYTKKLERLAEVTRVNAVVASKVAKAALDDIHLEKEHLLYPANDDLGKVRESLRHFVRDWSSEGAQERSVIFKPILDVLSEVDASRRSALKVLVPGSGLGRLAWEIGELGFDTSANELSPFMNFAFRFLLSPNTTLSVCQHTLHPFAHWFSHQRSNAALFRAVSFPDALPRLSNSFRLLETDFLKLATPQRYDYIVTQFFIDTSLNVISTFEQIHRLLRPGGLWINLGPLLWTGGAQATLELSLEEVVSLADKIGFEIDPRDQKTIDCEYTADKEAMMKWIYKTEFWTAKRRCKTGKELEIPRVKALESHVVSGAYRAESCSFANCFSPAALLVKAPPRRLRAPEMTSIIAVEPHSRPLGLLRRLAIVALATWDLGFTSFGGPPVHFQIFHRRFVEKKEWIEEQTYQELFALCQALPGPASTKLGYCICLTYAGFLPALLQFVFWCLPGAVGMYILAICIAQVPETLPAPAYALLSGLNSATVGVIAVSAVKLSEKAISDDLTRIIVLGTGCAGVLYSALWYFPALMIAGGVMTLTWDTWRYASSKNESIGPDPLCPVATPAVDERTPLLGNSAADFSLINTQRLSGISRFSSRLVSKKDAESDSVHLRYGSNCLGLIFVMIFGASFLVILIVRALRSDVRVEYKLFSNLFLAGTIIFGGGPVVVPLLNDYIVNEGWVSSRDFLIGLALIQAFPGPNFNFAIFLSALAVSSSSSSPLFMAFIGFIGIFSPGMVLATGLSALWHSLRRYTSIISLLRGVNAAAVGLVWTAVYRLWEAGYLKPDSAKGTSLGVNPYWVVVGAVAFGGNRWFGLPPPMVIVAGGVFGLLTVFL